MKLIEKLKNVFFEEVPEDEDEEELPQTFAKKIEPKKNVEPPKVHEFKREEREVVPEEYEEVKEPIKMEEPEKEKKEEPTFPMMFDDEDFLADSKFKDIEDTNDYTPSVSYKREEREPEKELYQGKKELSYIESVKKPNYSYTKSYYEEKETKGFRPSPIISPVYGVLDKNYHKEEVVTKKEVKLSTGRTNFDLDTVRNKAFGNDDEEISDKKTREAKMEEKEDKKIYDVNNNKPQVNRVTLADADEYYNDLGLAYNVDYSDASRNTNNTRTTKYNTKNNKKEKEVDDNLFDLIDSMYNKED